MSLPIKTMIQQKYVRDYSFTWFTKYSQETNSSTFSRYSSISLGTDGKFRQQIQTPSISFLRPCLGLCSCSSCLLTHGCLGTISNFYVPSTCGHVLSMHLEGWSAGGRSWLDTETQIMLQELLPKPSNTRAAGIWREQVWIWHTMTHSLHRLLHTPVLIPKWKSCAIQILIYIFSDEAGIHKWQTKL